MIQMGSAAAIDRDATKSTAASRPQALAALEEEPAEPGSQDSSPALGPYCKPVRVASPLHTRNEGCCMSCRNQLFAHGKYRGFISGRPYLVGTAAHSPPRPCAPVHQVACAHFVSGCTLCAHFGSISDVLGQLIYAAGSNQFFFGTRHTYPEACAGGIMVLLHVVLDTHDLQAFG
jgi:hypothetical protein